MEDPDKSASFTLDPAEMSALFEVLEDALELRKEDEQMKTLVRLRDELKRRLS